MLKKIPEFLARKSTNINLLVFVFIFSMVFVNVYTPFEFSTWFNAGSDTLNFVYSSCTILGGMIILSISRIIMHFVNKKELIPMLSYVLWLAAEILIIVMLYTLVTKVLLNHLPTGADFCACHFSHTLPGIVLVFRFALQRRCHKQAHRRRPTPNTIYATSCR